MFRNVKQSYKKILILSNLNVHTYLQNKKTFELKSPTSNIYMYEPYCADRKYVCMPVCKNKLNCC